MNEAIRIIEEELARRDRADDIIITLETEMMYAQDEENKAKRRLRRKAKHLAEAKRNRKLGAVATNCPINLRKASRHDIDMANYKRDVELMCHGHKGSIHKKCYA